MREYIMPIDDTAQDWDEMFVAVIRKQEELIRCKDCKHMAEHKRYGYLGESAYTCESNMDGWILPNSYCSMAERKE